MIGYRRAMAVRYWPRSLIARILIVELGAILIAALVLPALMVWQLHAQVNRYEVQALTEQARAIGRGLRTAGGRVEVRLRPDLVPTYTSPYDGRAFLIVDARRRIKSRSPFAGRILLTAAPLGEGASPFRVEAIVGVSQPIVAGGTRLWVIVSQDETGRGAIIDDVVRAFVTRYAPTLLLILLLLPLINSVLIRRLVVAVRAVSAQAGTIDAQTLDMRLEETGLPLEVAPLAHATNALLLRLQESFQQQAEFVANVAHELRTPLTTLKFEIEGVEDEALREQIGRTTDRLGHVIAQLQALATLELPAQSFAPFDAVALAREVVAELAPQILANGDSVALDAPDRPIEFTANRTLIALALSNLIANATRHTPAGTAILVRVSEEGTFEVRDDGPGIASSDMVHARQRYWRADTNRTDSAGLGLSIVSRIMEVHGGALDVGSRPGQGARFVLRCRSGLDPAGDL
jgi:signal transduction histidine kinase